MDVEWRLAVLSASYTQCAPGGRGRSIDTLARCLLALLLIVLIARLAGPRAQQLIEAKATSQEQ
eukprot:15466275-Alexandrium_andersonii.AAC.1